MEMQRVIVYLPRATVRAADGLAARYGSNRSEVLRVAVAEGMQSAKTALRRLQKVKLTELGTAEERRSADGRKRAGRPAGSGAGARVAAFDIESELVRLVEYGRSALRLSPGISPEALRLMVLTHGQLIGVEVDELEDMVDEAMAEVFGREKTLPAPNPFAPPE